MNKYLIFYSNIHINSNGKEALLYNTLTGKNIVIKNSDISSKLYLLLNNPGESYFIKLEGELSVIELNEIIDKKMGRIIESEISLPIQYSPNININGVLPEHYSDGIKKKLCTIDDSYEKELFNKDYQSQMGKDIIDYFSILNLYYDSINTLSFEYGEAYKQYLFPPLGESVLMDVDAILLFLNGKSQKLDTINLIIGDLKRADLKSLKRYISVLKDKCIQIHLYTLPIEKEYILSLNDLFDTIYIWDIPNTLVSGYLNNIDNIKYIGLISNNEDYKTHYSESEIYPYYQHSNKLFCLNESSYKIQDILDSKISKNTILSSQTMNANLFGELSILPNGNIYSCLQFKEIGNVSMINLKEAIYKEFLIHKNWFIIRKNYKFCKKCIFNWICPPITNYELAIDHVLCDQCNI